MSWQTKLEAKLEVHFSIFHSDFQTCLASLAGQNLHDFINTTEKEGFLCMVEGNVGVHDDLCGSFWGNHGSYLNWEVLLSSVKSADTSCQL
jgi:hypothetical protein